MKFFSGWRSGTALVATSAFALLSSVGLAYASEGIRELNTHSIKVPFVDEGFHPLYWDFGGDVIIDTLKKIRLAPDYQSRGGWIWTTTPLPDDTWKVEFEFQLHGRSSYLYGDGMAFWATQERSTGGPVFGNRDYFTGLGIFFDSYANANHNYMFPHITGMVGDGRTPYDAASDGEKNSIGSCHALVRHKDRTSKAQVTYLKGQFLEVRVMTENDKWVDCFTANNVTLPEKLYLGFSAHTGEVTDNHDLYYVKTETMDIKTAQTMHHAQPGGSKLSGSSAGGALGWWFKLVAVGAVCGILVMAYRSYSAKQNERF
ncbi:hypothetical protein IWQ61_002825 [Dispira simplex]|nr:hypothetical protein IWQ61_002825 [Dispira simplex]